MRPDLTTVIDDLAAEEDSLADLLVPLDDASFATPTPAPGWTVLDQVAHLAEGEQLAAMALRDEAAFAEHLASLLDHLEATRTAMTAGAHAASPATTVARWERARLATIVGLRSRTGTDRILWIAGTMSSTSFASARLMETWAHGQDIADALGVRRPATTRLHHVAHLGVATRAFSFDNRALGPPSEPYVELTGPAGERWVWGDPAAAESVHGPAVDFCLVVTQRRHVDDTELEAHGDGARRWLEIAQCFAGPPTAGRTPSG